MPQYYSRVPNKRGEVGISGVGKNVKCEHSNVVINVAYSKLKVQLHFSGVRIKAGGWKNLENLISRGGRLFGTRE